MFDIVRLMCYSIAIRQRVAGSSGRGEGGGGMVGVG